MSIGVQERDVKAIVKAAIEQHGTTREALVPILSEINRAYGYISAEAMKEIRSQIHQGGEHLLISESELYSVASFYHMLSTTPLGRHVVRFCESAPCHVMGGREVFSTLKEALELEPGETTPDKKWSLITTSCLGVCGVGPVFLIDDDIFGNVQPDQVAGILAKYD